MMISNEHEIEQWQAIKNEKEIIKSQGIETNGIVWHRDIQFVFFFFVSSIEPVVVVVVVLFYGLAIYRNECDVHHFNYKHIRLPSQNRYVKNRYACTCMTLKSENKRKAIKSDIELILAVIVHFVSFSIRLRIFFLSPAIISVRFRLIAFSKNCNPFNQPLAFFIFFFCSSSDEYWSKIESNFSFQRPDKTVEIN